MRVLIITHPRSGGLSLCNWIQKESEWVEENSEWVNEGDEWFKKKKSLKIVHEPYNYDGNADLIKRLWEEDNIIAKVFPHVLGTIGVDINELAYRFDKVIIHKREDVMEIATSIAFHLLLPPKEGKKIDWHQPYKMDEAWLKENDTLIQKEISNVNKFHSELDGLRFVNCIRTTYEGIYGTGDDINKVIDYLNMPEPYYLDILNSRHRLRNGDVGMGDVLRKEKKRNMI